jgi:transcriptional regulator with XRE-family HTH domain
MQALFSTGVYCPLMATKSNLRRLREAAGLSVRELARQIEESPTNVSYWERSGQIPRSDVVAAIARVLGVSIEAVLGEAQPRRAAAPGGKVRQAFEAVSKLPRRQQEHVLKVVNALVAQSSVEN